MEIAFTTTLIHCENRADCRVRLTDLQARNAVVGYASLGDQELPP